MAKRKPANPFQGTSTIDQMDQWDVDEESENLQPFVEFERNDSGQFQFGCVHGQMDCRHTQREGKPAVERAIECECDMASSTKTTRIYRLAAGLGRSPKSTMTAYAQSIGVKGRWPRFIPSSRTGAKRMVWSSISIGSVQTISNLTTT